MLFKTANTGSLKKAFACSQDGAVLLYLIAVILTAGILGAAIVSLTTSSTMGELGYNPADQARHLAQSGLDYAASALEAEDPGTRNQFRNGQINQTPFNLENGRFILTVTQDTNENDLYHIVSEARGQEGTDWEAAFVVTGEAEINGGGPGPPGGPIFFRDQNIDIFFPLSYIIRKDTPESPGYTWDGEELILYDQQGRQLTTITATGLLRYSQLYGSIGTDYDFFDGGAVIAQDDSLTFSFPGNPAYTELTLYFSGFGPGDRAEIRFMSEGVTIDMQNINIADINDASAIITSISPFDSFTITNIANGQNRHFGLTGIEFQ